MEPIEDSLYPGALVLVQHAGQSVLARVEQLDRELVQVLTESGTQLRLKTAKVQLALPPAISPASPESVNLEELRNEVEAAAAHIDLATIRELLVTETDQPQTIEQLASVWFPSVNAIAFFSMATRLQHDTLYFRQRAGRYHPKSDKEVRSELVRQQGELRRSATREEVLATMVTQLQTRTEPQEEDLPRSGSDEEEPVPQSDHGSPLGKYYDVLLDYASHGDLWERRREATDLIEQLNRRLSGFCFAQTAKGAFDLLLALQLVEPHENLSIRRHRIRTTFEPPLLEEAARLAASQPTSGEGVTDLTALETFTIDDETTRDMDDALHVAQKADGTWELGVHIADVGATIEPGSPLDCEAARRGSSVYLPTGLIPMFPTSLSEGRFSLVAGEYRPTTSFLVTLDAADRVLESRVVTGVIRIGHRMTYSQADEILADPTAELHEGLTALERFAGRYRQRRVECGALILELPEVKVQVKGGEVAVSRIPSSASRRMVAELMVLAGKLAADLCLKERIPTVYRVQDTTPDKDLQRLESITNDLVRQLELARTLRRAELRSQPGPHLGLGLDAYVQATSPIRRYADLVVNYQLRRFLRQRALAFGLEDIVQVAAKAESASQECLAVQRETQHYWLLEYLRRQGPIPLPAIVLYHDPQLSRGGVPVWLQETALRGQVVGRGLVPGQEVQVRPVQVDPRRDLLRLELA
ncbi:MAG: RNB domain-containing ribonuclease [Bradymonadales bacterium]|nr:RNB domain-containing ribonuclease [Bradymonadales bacterium]